MIKILEEKNPKKKVNDPYYLLTYEYMIGDANGHTDGEVELSENNPFIERYCKLLSSLKATKGTWGLCLNCETIGNCFTEKQITEDDYKFLMRTMFPESFEDWEDEEEEDKMMENYFDGSLKQMVSFFSRKEKMSVKEMDDLLKMMENLKKEKP